MNILLPIETQSRELDYKLVLANRIVKEYPNTNVFIGSDTAIHNLQSSFVGGLYIGKTIFSSVNRKKNLVRHKNLKSQGFDVIYFHEEGAIWYGDETEWEDQMKAQYDLDIFDSSDLVFLWGETQKAIDAKRNTTNVPLVVTGSPRLDLNVLYPEIYNKQVEALKKRFGKFVLINGNYACNHGEGFHGALNVTYGASGFDNLEDHLKKWFMDWYLNEQQRMLRMLELVIISANRNKDITFIYRPHPSENIDVYDQYFAPYNNIKIVREGEVNPFILASIGVIHDGCTTGIESVKSDKPVLNYKKSNMDYEIYLTSLAGKSTYDLQEAIDFVDRMAAGDKLITPMIYQDKAKSLLENLDHHNAFDQFLQALKNKIDSLPVRDYKYPSEKEISTWYLKRKIRLRAAMSKNKLMGNENKILRDKYLTNKFPGIDKSEFAYKLHQINVKEGSEIQSQFYNPSLIRLYSKQ